MSGVRDIDCRDEGRRRADLLAHPALNGIDYVEVDPADHTRLRVFFLKPIPATVYGLVGDLSRIAVTGGVRVVGIRPVAAQRLTAPSGERFLEICVDRGGDHSPYELALTAPQLDPQLRRVAFSFMAACPVDLDCPRPPDCPPAPAVEPLLDYLAKDYASFRRLLFDLVPQLNPRWSERNPADLGTALVELLAYAGDRLSYFQDAVANEAYLETARKRISLRRHARLVDYRMHDGRNAWTWVHLAVGAPVALARGARLLTRIVHPLTGEAAPPGPVVPAHDVDTAALALDPALAGATVFETAHDVELRPEANEISLHAWGNEECCLAPGTTEAYLYAVPAGTTTAVRPPLGDGDLLLLEEVRGPRTGAAADADPAHRQVVRIEGEPLAAEDPLYSDSVADGALERWQTGDTPLPLLRVRWRREDALAFPLCLSAWTPETGAIRNVSVARGNVVLADHGATRRETVELAAPVEPDARFRLRLEAGPLTMQCADGPFEVDPATGEPRNERRRLDCAPGEARPAVTAFAGFPGRAELDEWTAVPDLLDSPPFARELVAEVDDDGRAVLRFGDGEYGREPAGADRFDVHYRIGNGRAGNVGAEALAHVAVAGPTPAILAVRNALAARGGTEPESVEEVRVRAPRAFSASQLRAVTEEDYAAVARRLPEVQGATATYRWTGSWHTVFVAVDPRDPEALVVGPDGRTRLDAAFEARLRAFLSDARLAGYDLELRPPAFVSLELAVDVCAAPGHFRTDVRGAALDALARLFDPENFTFAQPVYLSRIYATLERVEGVESALVTRFRRFGRPDSGELERGILTLGPWEIARLANDPSLPEHGVATVDVRGGKA